jgi:hypothetical protein
MNERLMTGRPPRVLFCGSRKGWATHPRELIRPRIDALPDRAVVVHGRAQGADTAAGALAVARGLFVIEVPVYPEHWERHGRAYAARMRNAVMAVLLNPEHDWVEAFFSGAYPERTNGTRDMVRKAEQLGLPVLGHWASGERTSNGGLGQVARA